MAVSFVEGKRTRDFAFVSLCYGRSGEEMCTGYAMGASGRMQYDYKQTNKPNSKFIEKLDAIYCAKLDRCRDNGRIPRSRTVQLILRHMPGYGKRIGTGLYNNAIAN